MEENYHLGPNAWLSLTSKLVTLFGFFLLGSFFGQFFGLLAVVYIIGFPTANIEQFQKMVMDFMVHPEKYENAFHGMMALQWFTALFTFVLGSWAYLHYIEKRSIAELNVGETPNWKIFLWAILTILVSMPFLEYVIQWNQNLILPAGFEELESWMKTSEQNMAQLTKFLLNFTSPTDFAIAIAVIGGMAALGEEIFFRGVVQSLFERYIGNAHVAIWVSAAIFSFIHMQFYGFFPRLFLGAFFGYLYVWFRTIWVPIAAHFFNNAWTLLMHYLYQQKQIQINPEEMGAMVPWWSALLSLALVAFYIKRLYTFKTD
ncbi:MAG: CPBP family intramembrane metalloprotease [Cytophagia bacterium]|nr:CPBP family intramembrane metalloprotease [Cytophagia bacterium]